MNEQFLWFYATAAQMSFVLLGFWWAVVTLKRDEWLPDPRRMRIAYCVTIHFIVAGIGSLVSLLAVESSAIWRVGFGLAGTMGLGAALMIRRDVSAQPRTRRAPLYEYGWFVQVLVYVSAVVVAAGGTPLIHDMGFEVPAVQVEAVLVGLLLFLGAQLSWELFVESWRGDAAGSAS